MFFLNLNYVNVFAISHAPNNHNKEITRRSSSSRINPWDDLLQLQPLRLQELYIVSLWLGEDVIAIPSGEWCEEVVQICANCFQKILIANSFLKQSAFCILSYYNVWYISMSPHQCQNADASWLAPISFWGLAKDHVRAKGFVQLRYHPLKFFWQVDIHFLRSRQPCQHVPKTRCDTRLVSTGKNRRRPFHITSYHMATFLDVNRAHWIDQKGSPDCCSPTSVQSRQGLAPPQFRVHFCILTVLHFLQKAEIEPDAKPVLLRPLGIHI